MSRLLTVFLLAATLVVAGCVGPAATELEGAPAPLLTEGAALWSNPQTAPHPLFGFPTLTHPASGAVPELWRPIPALDLPDRIEGLELLGGTGSSVASGAGIAVFGGLAIVPGFSGPTHILDIRDPANPTILGKIEQNHRNVDLIPYPDGRLVAVFSTGAGILPVWDITDPSDPVELPELRPATGTHKVNIVPGTPIVYNANSNGGGLGPGGLLPSGNAPALAQGQTEIFDLTDPENPVHVQDWKNGYGCHHIYFWISEEKQRALCAGIEMTQIWDIADPLNPEVVVNVPVHHGRVDVPATSLAPVMFSHFAILSLDGTTLIVGDETGGGAAAGCDAYLDAGAKRTSGPLGNVWFYDVSDETDPQLQGWLSPDSHVITNPDPMAGCTAHHGRLVPDKEGRDLLAMAFYGAGVLLIDFTDAANPAIVDQWNDGTNTWEVTYYNGYLFTGDLNRGFDVLAFR